MELDDYLTDFQRLKVNKKGDHESPHKPCMLLAVIGLAEAGQLEDNKIRFTHALLDRYFEIFSVVKTESDHANPYFPYFHLKSENFWYLQPLQGREAVLAALDSARTYAAVEENIDYAYLDSKLYDYLLNAESRFMLRDTLITRWFGAFSAQLHKLVSQDAYESNLRQIIATGEIAETAASFDKPTRDTAFRRIVTEAYDYRCAATGMRIVLPGELIMVEAAHLIPFSDTQDDDPRNGIALTPDLHWALDRNIIAPGPDLKWHVSKLVDSRIADNLPLIELDGKEILLPRDKRYWPRDHALARRLSELRRV